MGLFWEASRNKRFRLSYNQSMRNSIRSAIENGLPTYAECGGMMINSEIEDYTHCFYPW